MNINMFDNQMWRQADQRTITLTENIITIAIHWHRWCVKYYFTSIQLSACHGACTASNDGTQKVPWSITRILKFGIMKKGYKEFATR